MRTFTSLLAILALVFLWCKESEARSLMHDSSPHRRPNLAEILAGTHKNTRSVDSSGHYTVDSIGGGNILAKYYNLKGSPYYWDQGLYSNIAPPLYPSEYDYRTVDSIGGGNVLSRSVDSIGGGNVLSRTVDSIGGGNVLGLRYGKRMDSLSGMSLGMSKRSLGDVEHPDFEQDADAESSS